MVDPLANSHAILEMGEDFNAAELEPERTVNLPKNNHFQTKI